MSSTAEPMPKLEQMPEPHIYQACGLYLLRSKHRFVRRLQRAYKPRIHGYKAWESSFLLMDYLRERPPAPGLRVMEIGCGWGAAGVFCAKAFGAKVTAVDADGDVFPFMQLLATMNGVEVAPLKRPFERLTTRRLAEEQLLVGSDICFWERMVNPLVNLVGRALRGGVPRVVFADPGRTTFYELAARCAKRWNTELTEWYATDPRRAIGEVLEVRLPSG